MGIFKKLFKRKKKEEKKQAECWYNNAHELPADKWVAPEENGVGPKNDNTMWYSTAQHAHKQS